MGLRQRIAEARREIRRAKVATPHMFPQWQELQQAKQAAREANERLARAKAAWEVLGKD